MNIRKSKANRKILIFLLCLVVSFQLIPITSTFAENAATLTPGAAHSNYIGNTDPVQSNYGKGDYLYSTLTVTGDLLNSEKVYSVREIEALAYQNGLGLGFEGNYSFKNSGGTYSSQVMTGIRLYDFLVSQCGMSSNLPDTTHVKYIAKDGYSSTITIGNLKSTGYSYYQNGESNAASSGLPVMLSFASNGLPLVGPTGDESVNKSFTESEGYNALAGNSGGPLKVTIGQTSSDEYNAMLNGKWITRIVVGNDIDHTKHTVAEQAQQALTVKVYEDSAANPTKAKTYTLGDLEDFAGAASTNLSRNYYDDGSYYEGVNLWRLIAGDADLGLSSYNGSALLKYSNGDTETIEIPYFQNPGGSYQNYTTTKSGLTITCVKPILAYSRNGTPTSNGAVLACLPKDGTYKDSATVKECTEICFYVGSPSDVHKSAPYSNYAGELIQITGSGIKTPGSVSVGGIEENISYMFSGSYTKDSQSVTFSGINLYRFLQSRKLTVDAENVILRNHSENITIPLSQLKTQSATSMLAFSRNGLPLVPDAASDGYVTANGNSGGPILFVSNDQYLENVTSIEITRANGQWNHFDGDPNGYEFYLDTARIRIHGSQSKADTTVTLRQLEGRTNDIVRDSFAAGGGCFGFEGVVLKNLIDDYHIDNVAHPSKITVIGEGGYRKDLDVDDVYSGIESQYQPGETRDIILAYGVNGKPLVPTSSSIGYVEGVNGYGPVRLIVENTVPSWVKGVSEIIIGAEENENVNYTASYYQTKARASNSDREIPGMGYTTKTFSGTVGAVVTLTSPVVPGWVFAGYEDSAGTFHETTSGAIQLTLSADSTQNKISLRYNVNAGLLIVGDSLQKNYWYPYETLSQMAVKATDYSVLNSDSFYTANLYSVVKRGGVPSNMFGAGIDLPGLLSRIGGSGSQKVTLYSADGGSVVYGGSSNTYNFSTSAFADDGYYYYPDVLTSGTSATAAGQSHAAPMLAFRVKDISWIYSNLDTLGAPTQSSQLLDQPTMTEDVQPIQNGIQSGTENIAAWEASAAYPYPFLMTGQTSPSHFNNTDYFKMVHGIAVGTVSGKLTISKSSSTKEYTPMTFVKSGFEQIPFCTTRAGISLERLTSLSAISLASSDKISFTGQASAISQATGSTLSNYYISLNADPITSELDKASPFLLVHKNGSSIETATISGIVILASTSGSGESTAQLPATPVIKHVDLVVNNPEVTEEATSVTKITASTDSNGNALAQVKPRDINESLKDVLAAREKVGAGAIAEINLQVSMSSNAKKLTVDLPTASLKEVAAKENTQITLSTGIGDIQLTNDVLKEIISQADGAEVSVGISLLSEDEQSKVSDANDYEGGIFDLSIKSNGETLSDFNGETVTVSLPYQLTNGQKAAGVCIYYINKEGKPSVILNSKYDEKTRRIVFQTNHFSYYAVAYDENAIQQVFSDVSSAYWAAGSIRYVAGEGLFQGVSDTCFAPQNPMTRGMFVTALSRMGEKNTSGGAVDFTDVKKGQWYTGSIQWAANSDIVEGYANNTFGPNEMVAREQMAVFLYRYAKWAGYDVKVTSAAGISSFSDSGKVSGWAKDAMIWAVDRGLMSGVADKRLDPQGMATRAQVAAIAERFSEKIVPTATTVDQSTAGTSSTSSSSSSTKTTSKYTTVPTKPYVTIKGSGLNNTIYLTYDDLMSMDKVTVTYSGRNKENNNARQYLKFTGVNLATILNAAGWKGTATTIKVNCTDGYTRKYDINEIMNDYVAFQNDDDTSGYWVPAMVALLDTSTFRLVYGQESTDTNTTMSFNMQGWANHLQTIEIN